MVEEGGGRVGVAGPGGQVEGGVAAQVHLVQLQALPRHLLAQPAGYTVLEGKGVSQTSVWEFNIELSVVKQCSELTI